MSGQDSCGLVILGNDLARFADHLDPSFAHQQNPVRVLFEGSEPVRHENDRLALLAKTSECRIALVLEFLIAYREYLVEKKDVEVDLDRDRVRQTYLHP